MQNKGRINVIRGLNLATVSPLKLTVKIFMLYTNNTLINN